MTSVGNGEVYKTDKERFGTPNRVWSITEDMQYIERQRAFDRSMIDNLFNGGRPWTADEVKKHDIQVNVNWGEGKRILTDATRQLNSAVLHGGTLFNCECESAPQDVKELWELQFTKFLHEPFQKGRSAKRHDYLIRSQNSSISLHGIGPTVWMNDFDWLSRYVALEDLLIPTDTICDFHNLRYFAVNLYLTPGELVEMTQREKVDKGWNQKMVRGILNALRNDLYGQEQYVDWLDRPEAAAEIHKQNPGFYYSDAVPTVKLRAFFFQDTDNLKWYRKIILRETIGNMFAQNQDDFVYDCGNTVFANDIDEILNVQYGDTSLVAPLKYHSVRGLGVDLFAPVFLLNKVRCEFAQHVLEQLKMYFKIQDPADRDRLKQVVLQQYGFIPEGLQIVPREQRHQIDGVLVEHLMGQMRQIMQESSASFVQDTAGKADKEMTAREAMIRLNQATVMISGMLQSRYMQLAFYYAEVKRRFLRPNSPDKDVKDFQAKCIQAGIPPQALNNKLWTISPERVIGGGDRSQAEARAMWLWQNMSAFEPQAQQQIKRTVTAVMLDDPARAVSLVPPAPNNSSSGSLAADSRFGTLMEGVQVSPIENVERADYIKGLLRMTINKLTAVTQANPVGSPELLLGLANVLNEVKASMEVLAQNPQNGELVRTFSQIIGDIENELKAVGQRLSESMQAQQEEGNAEAMAKIQADLMSSQVKNQIAQAKAVQGMQLKQSGFQQKQRQQAEQHALDQSIKLSEARTDTILATAESQAEMARKDATATEE